MRRKLADVIAKHYHPGITLFALERLVFPEDQYPNAYRRACHGGPPACRRTLVAALKRHGYTVDSTEHRWVFRK